MITAHHGQVPGHLTVQQALLLIINGIEDILGMASFSTLITIPSIYFDDNIPLFHGQLPDYFLEIRFNF